MAAQSMAEICLWMLGASLPTITKMVLERPHHSALPPIRVGRWDPSSLENLGPGLHLFVRLSAHTGIPLTCRYYAIACALALSLLNWVLIGLFDDVLDLFYLESWQVFLTCIVIFSGLSNISSAIFQYRLNSNSLGNALIGNFKVSPTGIKYPSFGANPSSGSSFSSSSSVVSHGISPLHCKSSLGRHLAGSDPQTGPFDRIQHAMGLYNQRSRTVTLFQRMASHVEAILGHLDRFLGYHPRCRTYGLKPCPLRIQDNQLYLYSADYDSSILSFPLSYRFEPLA